MRYWNGTVESTKITATPILGNNIGEKYSLNIVLVDK